MVGAPLYPLHVIVETGEGGEEGRGAAPHRHAEALSASQPEGMPRPPRLLGRRALETSSAPPRTERDQEQSVGRGIEEEET